MLRLHKKSLKPVRNRNRKEVHIHAGRVSHKTETVGLTETSQILAADSLFRNDVNQSGYLSAITKGQKVLIIGTVTPQLADVFREYNVSITAEVSPANGDDDITRVLKEASQYDFDIALVFAGLSGVAIADWIQSKLGKVAIDFGKGKPCQ